jgi:hypothetical protein
MTQEGIEPKNLYAKKNSSTGKKSNKNFIVIESLMDAGSG